MRAPVLALAILSSFLAGSTTADDFGTDEDIFSLCAEDYPSDFVLQRLCIRAAVRDRERARAFNITDGHAEMAGIWRTCLDQYTDKKGRTEWPLLVLCVNAQVRALEDIDRSKAK